MSLRVPLRPPARERAGVTWSLWCHNGGSAKEGVACLEWVFGQHLYPLKAALNGTRPGSSADAQPACAAQQVRNFKLANHIFILGLAHHGPIIGWGFGWLPPCARHVSHAAPSDLPRQSAYESIVCAVVVRVGEILHSGSSSGATAAQVARHGTARHGTARRGAARRRSRRGAEDWR